MDQPAIGRTGHVGFAAQWIDTALDLSWPSNRIRGNTCIFVRERLPCLAGKVARDIRKSRAMVPGIDPKIDYAFKRLFGSVPNQPLLMHLLNAVLDPPPAERVVGLEILNPFNDKDALDDKLSVVDIKARDQSGRQFNIEMQLLAYPEFRQRVLYYWARLYQQQLHESEPYKQLRPTISICFINRVLFPETAAYRLSFRLLEPVHQVVFTEDLALHMLELPKFTRSASELASPLDAWLYFLRYAEGLDAEALPSALRLPEIQGAMEVLKMLTQSDSERERYEARLKLERDRLSYDQWMQELREQSPEETLALGELVGRIHGYQERLGFPLTPTEDLLIHRFEGLKRLADELKRQLST